MKISKNFSREEFACKCGTGCGYDTVDTVLLAVIQDVRDHFGKPVKITSGNRCPEYNLVVGGSPKSQHPLSRAADIQVDGVNPSEVQAYLHEKYPDSLGIGSYDDFTHVDSRNIKARWRG